MTTKYSGYTVNVQYFRISYTYSYSYAIATVANYLHVLSGLYSYWKLGVHLLAAYYLILISVT